MIPGVSRGCRVLAVLLACQQAAQAGPLGEFVKAAATPAPASQSDKSSKSSSSSAGEGFKNQLLGALVEIGAEVAAYCIVCSGGRSMIYALGTEGRSPELMEMCEFAEQAIEPRRKGDVLIPFARADIGYQAIRQGPIALDIRAEGGYSLLGLGVRRTTYWDRKTDETMSITAIVPEYRMLFGKSVEVDAGFGPFFLDGATHHVGTTFTLPVLIHPVRYAGLEFRPAWSNLEGSIPIADYGLNLVLRTRYAAIYGGYRWLRSGGISLDGPVGGVSAFW